MRGSAIKTSKINAKNLDPYGLVRRLGWFKIGVKILLKHFRVNRIFQLSVLKSEQ